MTDRLAPTDAAFLYADDTGAPLQVGGVVIVQPRGAFDYQRVMATVVERLDLLPRLRQVVRRVPGNLARPVWVDDVDFDLSYHVRRSSLPRPGSDDQLEELVGRLISRPLDRERPLWELYLVEGLADGRVALVNKTHQALSGRSGSADIVAALLDDTPGEDPGGGPGANPTALGTRRDGRVPSPWIPAPEPSATDLLLAAVGDVVAAPTTVFDAARLWRANIRQAVGVAVDVGRSLAGAGLRAVQYPDRTLLRALRPGPRIYATASIDLEHVKEIRRRHGTTVNDVILAVVAGALRSWLISHGDPVASSARMVALAPMSVRSEDSESGDTAGVTSFFLDLPISEANPVMRLHHVAFHTRPHSASQQRVGALAMLSLGSLAPAALHQMGARLGSQLSRRSYDMLVTNVPGPQHQLYAAGDPVNAMFPVVPLVKGHALAIGCTSYQGQVHFGLTADRDAMPDAQECVRLIVEEAAGLLRASARPRRERRGSTDPDDERESAPTAWRGSDEVGTASEHGNGTGDA